jgi:copper chaperone NosL
MLISSDAHAAQAHEAGQETRFYDDIGCLAADARSRHDKAVRYVRLASGAWSAAEDAWFARPLGVKTPMDYGVVAFATKDDAQQQARDHQAHGWSAIVKVLEDQ